MPQAQYQHNNNDTINHMVKYIFLCDYTDHVIYYIRGIDYYTIIFKHYLLWMASVKGILGLHISFLRFTISASHCSL